MTRNPAISVNWWVVEFFALFDTLILVVPNVFFLSSLFPSLASGTEIIILIIWKSAELVSGDIEMVHYV